MLTTSITNSHFHSRVLSLLQSYNQAVEQDPKSPQVQAFPLIPALEDNDTPLTPGDTITHYVYYTSSWIDLGSPDPVIAHLSRQVFIREIAYAGFLNASTIVIPGPRLSNGSTGISQYARAIKEALSTGSYLQLHILMPMDGSKLNEDEDGDVGDLARFARPEYATKSAVTKNSDPYNAWDAWNTIRTICKYHSRLSVGKNASYETLLLFS